MKPVWVPEFHSAWEKLMRPCLKRNSKRSIGNSSVMECLPSVHEAPASNSSPTHKNIFFLLKWSWGEMRVCQNKPPRSKNHILGSARHRSFFFRVKSSLPTCLQVLMYLLTKQSGK